MKEAKGTPRDASVGAARPKNRKYVLLRLWRYLARYRWLLALALLLTLASNLFGLVGPMLSGYAIDAIHGPGDVDFSAVFLYAGLMAGFYLLASLLAYILSRLMIRLSQKVAFQMRKDVFDHLAELPVSFFDRTQTGDIVSRISYDIDTVNASLSNDLLQICTSLITVVGSLAMMLLIAPVLVTVFAVTIPAAILFTRYMTRRVRPLFRRRSARLGELNGYVEEVVSGHKTIRVYHQENTVISRFDGKNTEAVEAYYNADYYGSMTGPSVNFINNLSLSLVSVMGAVLYLFRSISLGDLSSFVLYSRKFSGPINEAANILSELQSACAAAERVFHLIDEEPEPADAPGAEELADVLGDVRMEHVRFGYLPGQTVIHGLSLHAEPGSLTAIVGPTGAGKTTLINLLMRFYDPQAGTILVDGKDISTLTRRSLRRAYTMVLQDTWLFTGTVYENIAYGKEDATLEEVQRACRAAYIHEAILRLPQGYDTVLTGDGSGLSKGQKQMLTIARAMLLDSRMLILDEATSNVDTQTEQKIQRAMRELMRGKTCFVIAHRLSTIQNADHILVVRGGDIVEQGTHEALLQRGGFYAQLYHSQFQ
ncbi:ABC transporter ATP-binding protein [Hydrogeniiclostridium mannosilyticum]|uniref:ABC transporter ATP-binding protein n=1 Tax=Hydrogeniiclostridium mannosilyticum TaxID=2764322 RepID=A0A328UNQ4_9FIRM|nr:ABC transporter ATP-binding protein [Hydrogeniiclostridium mannosilyticum]RAQ30535.1 ABC transporter ATP-binding protein [Hydrogeniiclostridium mannosilyticum]